VKGSLCVLMCKLNFMTIINKNALIIFKLLIYNNFFSKFQLFRSTFPYAEGPPSQGCAMSPLDEATGAVRKHYKSTGSDRHAVSRQTSKTVMGAYRTPWTFADQSPA
jgi:hypothetical protein